MYMKKVIMVFLGLVLLSQVCKVYERRHEASVRRNLPVRVHPAHPEKDRSTPEARVMLAWAR